KVTVTVPDGTSGPIVVVVKDPSGNTTTTPVPVTTPGGVTTVPADGKPHDTGVKAPVDSTVTVVGTDGKPIPGATGTVGADGKVTVTVPDGTSGPIVVVVKDPSGNTTTTPVPVTTPGVTQPAPSGSSDGKTWGIIGGVLAGLALISVPIMGVVNGTIALPPGFPIHPAILKTFPQIRFAN
ncbi:hypothetical protein QVA66_04770, partial [Staphylococcus chromogenes]|nr:hypothetical protein [Staphylococcus chromogenes]